jgi:hypothetical protein
LRQLWPFIGCFRCFLLCFLKTFIAYQARHSSGYWHNSLLSSTDSFPALIQPVEKYYVQDTMYVAGAIISLVCGLGPLFLLLLLLLLLLRGSKVWLLDVSKDLMSC